MEVALTLDQLAVGRSAAIAALSAPESQRRRLLDLGFVPGSAVTAVQESPWGTRWPTPSAARSSHCAGPTPAELESIPLNAYM